VPQWLLTLLNPMRPLCDDWCLHLWEVVGVWFTGFATFAAVVTSLLRPVRAPPNSRPAVGALAFAGDSPFIGCGAGGSHQVDAAGVSEGNEVLGVQVDPPAGLRPACRNDTIGL
jgi:hypothetical protein